MPKALSWPMMREPRSVPVRLPMPPTTTTMNDSAMTSTSIPGADEHRSREDGRARDGPVVGAPRELHDVADDEHEGVGDEQLVQLRAPVDGAEEDGLDEPAR